MYNELFIPVSPRFRTTKASDILTCNPKLK